jgi:hypothetical protein
VLVVDPDRKRIALTAKKTLLESDLPILSKFEDVKVGVVTHAVVFKVLEKHLMVEFYNNLKATIPFREARYLEQYLVQQNNLTQKTVKRLVTNWQIPSLSAKWSKSA